jgi:hypothetical protein
MSCYSGGENWLSPPGTGICAFNCTLRHTEDPTKFCNNITGSGCEVFCNTLGFYWNITSSIHQGLGQGL